MGRCLGTVVLITFLFMVTPVHGQLVIIDEEIEETNGKINDMIVTHKGSVKWRLEVRNDSDLIIKNLSIAIRTRVVQENWTRVGYDYYRFDHPYEAWDCNLSKGDSIRLWGGWKAGWYVSYDIHNFSHIESMDYTGNASFSIIVTAMVWNDSSNRLENLTLLDGNPLQTSAGPFNFSVQKAIWTEGSGPSLRTMVFMVMSPALIFAGLFIAGFFVYLKRSPKINKMPLSTTSSRDVHPFEHPHADEQHHKGNDQK